MIVGLSPLASYNCFLLLLWNQVARLPMFPTDLLTDSQPFLEPWSLL
jgi:hypothetical protein